jgi:Arc/MetJ-type ribon-helix-helix transcriptional regulator
MQRMIIHLPEDLANSIRVEVLSGHFSSEAEMVAADADLNAAATNEGLLAEDPNLHP